MSNHITNIIKVTGSTTEVKNYLRDNQEFTFENFIPLNSTSRSDKIDNWGTKWDAYEVIHNEDGFIFDTAWSHPAPVIKKMSKMYPNLTFEIKFVDEDLGYNMGHYIIKNGISNVFSVEEGDLGFAISVRELDGETFNKEHILDTLYSYMYLDGDRPKKLNELGSVEQWIVDKYGLELIYELGDERINNFMSILMEDVVINKKLSIFIDKVDSNGKKE